MKMEKSAGVKQIFTFLLIAIIIGLIFLFSIKTIPGILEQSCNAEEVSFIKDLRSYIDKYDSYGSVNIESMLMPCNNRALCFVDYNALGNSLSGNPNAMMNISVSNNISKNVFLLEGNIAKPIHYSKKIEVSSSDYICLNQTGGHVKIKFVGKGDKVSIEKP